MLLQLLQQWKPTHLGVAFDISRYSFRTREYPEYKGTRGETPEEFKGQIPLLQEALHAMRIKTLVKEDFEADDILATLAHEGAEAGFRVYVVSGDRDTIQLVNDRVTLLYPNVRGVSELKVYDPAAVEERYGIRPEQYPEIAALVGETSDNLPGVEKVGEKTAVKWIQEYGTAMNLLEHADEIKGVVGENLRAQRDRVERNRRLNRLLTDVELPYAPAALVREPIDAPAVKEVFGRLQFRTLLDRVFKLDGIDPSTVEAAPTAGEPVDASQRFAPSATGDDPDGAASTAPAVQTLVDEELAKWLTRSGATKHAVGVQVTAPDGRLGGLGLSTLNESVWVPWGAHRPDYAALEAWLADPARHKVLYGAKRQLRVLDALDIEVEGIVDDPQIGAWLAEPWTKGRSLADAVDRILDEHVPTPDPNQLVPTEAPLSPATEAWFALRLDRAATARLDDRSRLVLEQIEVPLIPVLDRMERQGVTVDGTSLAALSARLKEQAGELAQRAYAVLGREVNLASPKQLQEVLFSAADAGGLGLSGTRKTASGGYSTDADALADLAAQTDEPHPFLDLLLQHREATKLGSMVDTLVAAIGADGRVHTTYDQTGAATGRLASSDPNLQNIPVRTEVGHEIRAAFVAGAGFETLLTADYSQIEMRIMAHLSGDRGLIEAFNSGEDLHRFVGARIFGVAPENVTSLQRTKVKAMSYGLAYGLSAFGLSKQLRISQGEAKALMADYFERFGGVRDYLREVVAKAKEDGYTETMSAGGAPSRTSSRRIASSATTPSAPRSTPRSRAPRPTSSSAR